MNFSGNVMQAIFVGPRPITPSTLKQVTLPLVKVSTFPSVSLSFFRFLFLALVSRGSDLCFIATMQKTWIDKLNMLISPEEADVIKLGGVDSEEALKSHIDASISREAEDRWRCTVPKCTKLFLEQKFVHSHIQKRHKEWLERANVEVFSPKTHTHTPNLLPDHSSLVYWELC
jgi:uncharacterized C2H2 Zn-finger protein